MTEPKDTSSDSSSNNSPAPERPISQDRPQVPEPPPPAGSNDGNIYTHSIDKADTSTTFTEGKDTDKK